MPFTSNNNKNQVFQNAYSPNRLKSKKTIFIELTTILFFTAFVVFKTALHYWHLLPELLWSLVGWLTGSPLVAGALLSYVTWHVMYFDSAAPGVNPPTPLSPSKYRVASGADFHLNYLFAMAIGPSVTALLYTGWI